MNIRKIIAFCMIILSVFLQVSYAVGNSEQVNASSDKFRVRFTNIQYNISDEFGLANISVGSKNDTAIEVIVDNIYPGIYYNVNASLENIGTQSIKVTNINLISKIENKENDKLYDMIVGFNDENIKLKLDNYINFLHSKYAGKIIKANESLAINLAMGMDEDITDLENTSCEYEIIINFEQVEDDDEGNDDDDNGNGNGGDDDNGNNPGNNDNEENKDKDSEDKPINTEDENTTENTEVDATQLSLTGEESANTISIMNILPKAGEKLPISMYITGLALMLGGIYLLKKEKKTI